MTYNASHSRQLKILTDRINAGEKWGGKSATTQTLDYNSRTTFRLVNDGVFVKIIDKGDLVGCHKIIGIFAVSRSTDAVTRIRIVCGDDPAGCIASGDYTETMFAWNGQSHIIRFFSGKMFEEKNVWMLLEVEGNIAGDAWVDVFACVQHHKVSPME